MSCELTGAQSPRENGADGFFAGTYARAIVRTASNRSAVKPPVKRKQRRDRICAVRAAAETMEDALATGRYVETEECATGAGFKSAALCGRAIERSVDVDQIGPRIFAVRRVHEAVQYAFAAGRR